MKTFAWIWGSLLLSLLLSSQAFAAADLPNESKPETDEHGICIPTMPIAECEGPNPPNWCNSYDPDYGDWFVPGEGQGILELLLRGMKHVYAD